MRTAILVQARMTSARLPGKVLVDLGGRPMLAREIERLRRCRRADAIVVATTTSPTDDAIAELARSEAVGVFRGDEQDVLGRYAAASREAGADVVVRVTADCPLCDPDVIDHVIAALVDASPRCDYASNVVERTYPRGLDAEALWAETLYRVDSLARSPPAREHVTWLVLRERPELFTTRSVRAAADDSDQRWTVDTPEDLAMVRRLWDEAGLGERPMPYRDLVRFVRARADILALNAGVAQKPD